MTLRAVLAITGALCLVLPVAGQRGTLTPDALPVGITEAMADAAQALLATMPDDASRQEMLGISKQAYLLLARDDPARMDWSYWPRPRAGLSMQLMSAEQRTLAHALLATLLSAKGHLKVVQIMQLEEVLAALEEVGLPRVVGDYFVVFFGEPSASEPWGWRFEGHHVSLNISVAGNDIRVTPTFLGANPAEIRSGSLTGVRALRAEEDLGRQLVTSMSASQRGEAILTGVPPRDILTGNLRKPPGEWEAWRATLQPQGIRVAALDAAQRALVQRIIDEVITTYRPEISAVYLKTIELDDLSFAWMGSLQPRSAHYYRLQGGDFVFEYENSQDNGNHIHSVWRSLSGDFGSDLLAEHYRLSHR